MTPRRLLFRFSWTAHRLLWRLSGHRLGARPPGDGLGTLFLVSTGWKTGATRRTGLFYVEDGPDYVVVASNAGADVDPSWLRNLGATPDAAVELGRVSVPVRGRVAEPAERERLWPRLVAVSPTYATYQAVMTREIPVVVLEPRG